ncbi:hypothetical protein [Nonomuraea sp. LPB2021202275-12-8]|uniref:hypothetical protein n=1 Tax=Nonomuraea sp. LPB2021202275-12-8 TaxID=3120159 RepID=UPI00300D02CB
MQVEARYLVRVNDLAEAAGLTGENAESPADAVAKLFQRDGWEPERYGSPLTLVDHSWSCGPQT